MKTIRYTAIALGFLAATASAKVITLDCKFPELPNMGTVRVSMDTDNQTVSETTQVGSRSAKLFSDGGSYWFTFPGYKGVERIHVDRQDLSILSEVETQGMTIPPRRGVCTIVNLPAPKI